MNTKKQNSGWWLLAACMCPIVVPFLGASLGFVASVIL